MIEGVIRREYMSTEASEQNLTRIAAFVLKIK